MTFAIVESYEIELRELANQINAANQSCGLKFKQTMEDVCHTGDLLLAAKDIVKRNRMKWIEWIDENLDITKQQANKYMRLAANKYKLLEKETQGSFSNFSLTGAIKQLSTGNNIDNPAIYSSNSDEWYTPALVINRVCKVMGGIDLDPCSNIGGSPSVPALKYYTREDDGLVQEWRGSVYMNPPYGREIIDWVKKLVNEFRAGRITQAIALVPSRTDTEWFFILRDFPKCFVRGRLKFSNNGTPAPFPSMAVYLGGDLDAFKEAFSDIGDIYARI